MLGKFRKITCVVLISIIISMQIHTFAGEKEKQFLLPLPSQLPTLNSEIKNDVSLKFEKTLSGGYCDVAYGNKIYAAVGKGGILSTSKDGLTWIPGKTGSSNDLNDILWTGSKFIAVGKKGTIITSKDGVKWNIIQLDSNFTLNSVIYAKGKYIAVGNDEKKHKGIIVDSDNEIAWKAQ
jgi:photosystem II stability/assembly factor-like uncharacterized protein